MTQEAQRHALREAAAAWVIRIDSGTLTPEEMTRLDAWVDADPAHADALREATRLWSDLDHQSVLAIARRRSGGHARPSRRPRRATRHAALLRNAAATFVGALICIGLLFHRDIDVLLRADVSTGTGETRTLPLVGGGTLRLDTQTAVAFQDSASQRVLEVLAGRVEVEVGHADPRPFKVVVNDVAITDIGTVFQVDARDERTAVSVSQGEVQVMAFGRTTAASAGERLVVGADAMPAVASVVDVDALDAWTRGRLVFEDRPLAHVVAELQRYYPGGIVLLDAAVGRRRVSGVFDASHPKSALRIIEKNLGLRLREWPGGIVTLEA